jgi:F0F1-type ATP synthase assembly protein I
VFDGVFDTGSYQLIVAAMLGLAIVNLIIWRKEEKSGKCYV